MAETATVPRIIAAVLGLAASFALGSSVAAQDKVGVNSAVNPDAEGTPPNAPTRRLELGQQIVHDEHIVTGADGQTQIVFLDASAMTVGPSSDLKIDDFVYDPSAGTGQLTMSATRGVMRFVGGKISKLDNGVTMNTPSASLGIRGGVFLLNLPPSGQMEVVFLYGKGLTVTANNQTRTLTHPGWSVTVNGPGTSPSKPGLASSSNVAALLGQLSGRTGSSGGSSKPPTDSSVAGSGISKVISGDVTASTQQATNNTPPPSRPPVINVGAVQSNFQINTVTVQPVVVAVSPGSGASPTTPAAAPAQPSSPTLPAQPLSPVTPVAPLSPITPIEPPTIALPTSGVGSFAGTASGTVVNNGATYMAAGSFNQIYNFGSRTGVINIGNFDSANYTYAVTGSSGSNFGGMLTTGPANRTGTVSGSFTGIGAVQTGGNFGIQSTAGTPYSVSGNFTGR